MTMRTQNLMRWACCALLCGMAACSDNDGGGSDNGDDENVKVTQSGYGKYPHGYDGTLTETTADGRIAGLPNDLGPSWGQGKTDVWDGTTDVSWYLPGADVYYINLAEQLAGLAVVAGYGEDFYGKTVILGVNVILNERIEMDEEYNVLNADDLKPWRPIVDFRGLFDGRGHVISGLYIDMEGSDYVGLFGGDGAWPKTPVSLCNLGMVNSYVRGNDHVNAFGKLGGDTRKCFSTAVVVGKGNDVCGIASGSEASQCFHKGVVISEQTAIGVRGESRCYNAGIVMGKQRSVGISGSGYNLYVPESNSLFFPISGSSGGYALYSENENFILDSQVIATFADNSGVLIATPWHKLPDGATTLVEALNRNDYGKLELEWIVDPERNNGYPVFAQDLYVITDN